MYWKAPRFSAVRRGDWKLVIGNDGANAELYDLAADPYETHDLAAQQPQRVSAFKQLWANLATQDR